MTTAYAIGVLVLAAAFGLAFLWWMFSGAAAWLEPDDERPSLTRDDRSSHDE